MANSKKNDKYEAGAKKKTRQGRSAQTKTGHKHSKLYKKKYRGQGK